MIELLRDSYHWVEGFADSPWALLILIINAFTEAIINPIPPDPLLIGMAVLHPNLALLFAAAVTIASVLGGLAGHWLGLRFGRPWLLRFISGQNLDRVEGLFQTYGAWVVLVAAFTPIPYKVFSVTAGVMELDRKTFLIASVVGRGARFFLLGSLIFFFGESIQHFIETRFELLTVLLSGILVAILGAGYFLFRRQRSQQTRDDANLRSAQSWESEEAS